MNDGKWKETLVKMRAACKSKTNILCDLRASSEAGGEMPFFSQIRKLLGLTAIAMTVTLSGCMVGPNFQRPQAQVPATWAGPSPVSTETATPEQKELADWWTTFDDATLTRLVQEAMVSNLDLKLSQARIREARAARRIAVSGLGPAVNATSSAQRSRSPSTLSRGGDSQTVGITANQYQAGFDASWEIDIFGGVRRGVEAADADLQATVESLRDVLVTLTAEVATNYIDLRSFQQRIVIAKQNLKAQEHSAQITRQRFEGGFASGLDVANADSLVATTSSQIPVLEISLRQTIYRLSVLLGREPGALVEELSPVLEIPAAQPSVPLGIPSELLRRRPDIRQAESNIHAATARIGVATADLFPRFNILGSAGFRAGEFSSWFDWVSRFWSFGPSIDWQIFNTGRTLANIEQREALEEQTVITYRQTVLTALEEVENALIASAKEEEHRKALVQAVAANRKAVDLATRLYTEGQTDFLNVLEAQRSLYVSEDALVQSNQTVSTNLVALYKALGGGWEAQAEGVSPVLAKESQAKGL